MPRLVINPNTKSAWEVQLKPGANLLGRGFANDFKIENPSVSGSHCEIVLDGAHAFIRDLGSTNGTFVNRSPVKEALLQPGQTIHLGGVEILFHGDSVPLAHPARTEVISQPVAVVPTPTFAAAAPRAITPTAPASVQAADDIPLPPPPIPVTTSPPRPAGISLAPRPADAHRGTPAPPPPAAIPAPVAVPVSPMGGPAVVGGGNCKFHPRTIGRYSCSKCHHYFCELCVASRTVGNEQHKFCRQCGTELTPVQVKVTYTAPKGFFSQLPGSFIYPIKGFGPLVLILSAVLLLGLSFFSPGVRYGYIPVTPSWTLIFRLLTMGYLFAFMQSIIHSTAIGEDEMASLPSVGNMWEDILLPGLQFLGLTLISFGPAIGVVAYMVFGPGSEEGGGGAMIYALIAAFIFGVFYFPMAFLAVAMLDSVMAANPIQIIPSIFKGPLEYFVTCIVLGVVASLPPIGDVLIAFMFPRALSTPDMGSMFGYLATVIFWRLFGLYLLVVGVRILGLLFRCKRDKLAWID